MIKKEATSMLCLENQGLSSLQESWDYKKWTRGVENKTIESEYEPKES